MAAMIIGASKQQTVRKLAHLCWLTPPTSAIHAHLHCPRPTNQKYKVAYHFSVDGLILEAEPAVDHRSGKGATWCTWVLPWIALNINPLTATGHNRGPQ